MRDHGSSASASSAGKLPRTELAARCVPPGWWTSTAGPSPDAAWKCMLQQAGQLAGPLLTNMVWAAGPRVVSACNTSQSRNLYLCMTMRLSASGYLSQQSHAWPLLPLKRNSHAHATDTVTCPFGLGCHPSPSSARLWPMEGCIFALTEALAKPTCPGPWIYC